MGESYNDVDNNEEAGAAKLTAERSDKRRQRHSHKKVWAKSIWDWAVATPLFTYFILGYLVLKGFGVDTSTEILDTGSFVMTGRELLYLLTAVAMAVEVGRVSEPGKIQIFECMMISGLFVITLVLMIIGIMSSSESLAKLLFANTEFCVIVVILAVTAILCFVINSRTTVRTITSGGGGSDVAHDH